MEFPGERGRGVDEAEGVFGDGERGVGADVDDQIDPRGELGLMQPEGLADSAFDAVAYDGVADAARDAEAQARERGAVGTAEDDERGAGAGDVGVVGGLEIEGLREAVPGGEGEAGGAGGAGGRHAGSLGTARGGEQPDEDHEGAAGEEPEA